MPAQPFYSEKELLEQLAEGDTHAFAQLFNKYRNLVFSYARELTGSASQAEEILQDVFLKIWLNRSEMNKIDYLSAYLRTITRNHTYNCLRRIATERLVLRRLNTETDYNNVDEQVYTGEFQKLVANAVERLSPQQKRIFQLSREKGMKHGEIARELNISALTVKSHLVTALKSIRTYLNEQMGDVNLPILMILLGIYFFE